jgi:uncharacterized membrane protein YvbJ
MREVRCYQCGKAIPNEDNMVVKKVSGGRQAFHSECWKAYHKTRNKKEALQWSALAVIAIFMVAGLPIYYTLGTTFGLIILGFMFAVLIVLAIKYYRI